MLGHDLSRGLGRSGVTYGPEALEDVEVDIILGHLLEDGLEGSRRRDGRHAGHGRVSGASKVSPLFTTCNG